MSHYIGLLVPVVEAKPAKGRRGAKEQGEKPAPEQDAKAEQGEEADK